ncbi:glycosyltransferase [Actinophytocola xanthii]|uniref:Glycosyl transferase n=1 Tax=Actinophytocola xanthii TaxID=1912961 RepID=A0A1Q8CKA7_9PSEU|nr:glycosyltransferase [Actinophytocola xanthii]OLF14797.1 glycosyl transferase [Actinophytocola xanthii]
MRIAMICDRFTPQSGPGAGEANGLSVHVGELSAALARSGHEVTVYTRRDGRRQAPTKSDEGYRIVPVPAGPIRRLAEDELVAHMGAFTQYLTDQWRDSPPDVVHSHYWTSGLPALFADPARRVPVVHTNHGLGAVARRHRKPADPDPTKRVSSERLISRSVARVVATSAEEVRELGRIGVPSTRTTVIPSGVDIDRFVPDGPATRKRLPHRIVTVGRLLPRKGLAELVAVLPLVPDTELVIVGGPERRALGEDPEAVRLRELAKRIGVADRVQLTGQVPRDRLPALLRSADLAACVPWYEPVGLVPLEAMACNVPVVATSVGALADTVVDGVTGLLVPPRRPRTLAAALNGLLTDPVKRSFLGAAGRDRAESRYPWRRIAEDTVRVYEQCVEQAAARSERSGGPVFATRSAHR